MTEAQLRTQFSSQTDMWETPQDFFDKLNAEFHFTMDACAVEQNAKCKRFISPQEDGLKASWDGVVWCNPPYGKTIEKWVQKAHASAQGGRSWSCSFPRGQTQDGFTTTSISRRAWRYASSKADSASATALTPRPSPLWS